MGPSLARLAGAAGLVLCLAGMAAAQAVRPAIEDLVLRGDLGLLETDLKQLVLGHYGGLPPVARIADVPGTVVRILRGEGFRQASATAEIGPATGSDRSVLTVQVQAGVRTTIASVDVTGTSPVAREAILARTGARVGTPFRERDISARLADLRAELRRSGYYKAVAIPRPDDVSPTEVSLALHVDAGPRVSIRYLPSRRHLPRGNIEDFIPIAQEHSVEDDLLDDAVRAIEDGLRRDGYWKASARHFQETPRPGELIVTFEIARGRRYRVDRVELPAGLQVTRTEIEAEPALKPGAWFSEERVRAALRRVVARHYWLQGYFRATAEPEIQELEAPPGRPTADGRVVIHPKITEGPRATIREIRFDLGPSPTVGEARLRNLMQSKAGAPYVASTAFADRAAILAFYANQGFEAAAGIEATFSPDETAVDLTINVEEGSRIRVGAVTVVGNTNLDAAVILREITLKPGDPYSEAARIESQQRLLLLGGVRNVRITPDPRGADETTQPVTITVVEAPATAIGGGGGVEVASRPRTVAGGGEEDRIEVSPRAFVELTRRNLGGRNRSASFFSRLSLRPTSAPGDPERDGKGFGFSEYRLSGTYRERYAFQSDTDVLVGFTSEQAVRTTFNFIRQALNGDVVHQVRRGVSLSGSYALEFNELFDERFRPEERSDIDRLFPQVRLSILSGGAVFDRRDDPIASTTGTLLTTAVDVAMRQIGSQVGYVKTFSQGLYFRPLSESRRAVLALRAQLGLARGFEREVPRQDAEGRTVLGPSGEPVIEVVADLPASQRFFAGGGTTVRGFGIDRLGAPDILNANGLSNGGNALIVLNAELRLTVGNLASRPFTAVLFADSGNVFRRVSDLDLGRLRGSIGLGARWDSPIGPLRLDLGRKLSQSTFAGRRESRWEWHFSLGQMF